MKLAVNLVFLGMTCSLFSHVGLSQDRASVSTVTTGNLKNGSGMMILGPHNTIVTTTPFPRSVVQFHSVAYEIPREMHRLVTIEEAIREFGNPNFLYNPKTETISYLSKQDTDVRDAIINALKVYAADLRDNFADTSLGDPARDSDAAYMLQKSLDTGFENAFPISDPKTITSLRSSIQGFIGFFQMKKSRLQLAKAVLTMDPTIKELCSLLESDSQILESIMSRDIDSLIDYQKLFILSNNLSVTERRSAISRLPEIVEQGRDGVAALHQLNATLYNYNLEHHGLAVGLAASSSAAIRGEKKLRLANLALTGQEL